MRAFKSSPMASTHTFELKYFKINEEKNNIGFTGCDFLSEGQWLALQSLNLGIDLGKLRIE